MTWALIVCTPGFCWAGPWNQTRFPTPEEAGRALVTALQDHDERQVSRILGGSSELIGSKDRAEDVLERERFVQKYQQMHRWVRESDGVTTLYVGAENWTFPIPLVSRKGRWRFDSRAGFEEIRFRRIGENEMTAMQMCDELIATQTHPDKDREADALIQPRLPDIAHATHPIDFHGYSFRFVPSSGGKFAAVAYPTSYRSSGVMTFIDTEDGGLLEKDLGPTTALIAGALTGYHPDATWTPVH